MTTDNEEGQKQAEQSNKPAQFAVGDSVRLKAGGPAMSVVAVEDYGNQIVCEVRAPLDEAAGSETISKETHSAASLEHVQEAQQKAPVREPFSTMHQAHQPNKPTAQKQGKGEEGTTKPVEQEHRDRAQEAPGSAPRPNDD